MSRAGGLCVCRGLSAGARVQVREAKLSKDLVIDQLRELFLELGHAKVNTKRQLEQLEVVRAKWEEVKKAAPTKTESVGPIKDSQGRRIKADIQKFTDDVSVYARSFRKQPFLNYATGTEAAYCLLYTSPSPRDS